MPPIAPARLLTADSADWPRGLSDLSKPPASLWTRGSLPPLARSVAIVGTRRPDPHGAAFARRLAAELAEEGVAIVSGGALGIDAEAHLGALDAGGKTVAVLATGLARLYPDANRPLFARIAEAGALLSEYADKPRVYPSDFLARNRLVAAMAQVVIVVQAPFRSGALSTAAHARRLGRPLLAVPHAPWDPRGGGCLTLLATGARVCRSRADVLSLSAPEGEQRPRPNPWRPAKAPNYQELDEDERSVVEALSGGSMTADEVCECTRLSAPRAQRAILMLTLSKVIQEVGCGRYARTDCL